MDGRGVEDQGEGDTGEHERRQRRGHQPSEHPDCACLAAVVGRHGLPSLPDSHFPDLAAEIQETPSDGKPDV
jgi:hypothetical protein